MSSTLHSVRVISSNGRSSSEIIASGLDWVATNFVPPEVATLNLVSEGGRDSVIDDAIQNLFNHGVAVIVAAGNFGQFADACAYSPSGSPGAIAVGATRISDARHAQSNVGPCVKLFAPGEDIVSASALGTDATAVESGTSFSAPAVAGVAALYLSQVGAVPPSTVGDFITLNATPNVISDPGTGSPSLLLYARWT